MVYRPRQRDIVIADFEPSKDFEIQKRRPALVMSRDNYNIKTNLVIVCPITSTNKDRPYLIPISSKNLVSAKNTTSKVNSLQVFSLDYTAAAGRNIHYVDRLDEIEFYDVVQKFLQNFSFQI